MDINFDFTITGVPDEAKAQEIANDISNMLFVKHVTDIKITYTDVTSEG